MKYKRPVIDKSGRLSYGIKDKHFQKAYTTPVLLTGSGEITGLYTAKNGKTDTVTMDMKFNKATGKKITLKEEPSKNYPGSGAFTLVDGIQNEKGLTRGREFIGYNGTDFEATIDIGTAQKISHVVLHTLQQEGSWIYRPKSFEVLVSANGTTYTSLGSSDQYISTQNSNGIMELRFAPTTTRFVKVVVKNYGVIPEGKPGAGTKGWLFADEIEIN